jgi:hypothetical protein
VTIDNPPNGEPGRDTGTGGGAASGREPDRGVDALLLGSLSQWAAWLVDTYEMWERIPPCWARHPGMVAELRVAQQLLLAIQADTADDVIALSRGLADWHDYFGRLTERLDRNPGRQCATAGRHRDPTTWDREGSAQRRRTARISDRDTA